MASGPAVAGGAAAEEVEPAVAGAGAEEVEPAVAGAAAEEVEPAVAGAIAEEVQSTVAGAGAEEAEPAVAGAAAEEVEPAVAGAAAEEVEPAVAGAIAEEVDPAVAGGAAAKEVEPAVAGATAEEVEPAVAGATAEEVETAVAGGATAEVEPAVASAAVEEVAPEEVAGGAATQGRAHSDAGGDSAEVQCIEEDDERPFQPDINFPSKDGRRFRREWFDMYKFLTYDTEKNVVRCHTCLQAIKKGLMQNRAFREKAFLNGFSNWKKATNKFKEHETSEVHQQSVLKLSLSKCQSIEMRMDASSKKMQKKNTETYLEVLSMVRGLARCGSALRGHTESGGNFVRMMEERCVLSDDVKAWFSRKTNFLTHDCQDEIVEIMAKMVQGKLAEEIRSSVWFSVIADGTTDVSRTEQVCICLRHVDHNMDAHEVFLGMYASPDSTSATLSKVITDVAQRLVYGMHNLRGMCFDGASNMAGRLSGVQARLATIQPKAIFVHCLNHSLDLALVEQAKQVTMIADVMYIVREVSTALDTTKRKNIFREHVIGGEEEKSQPSGSRPTRLLSLCPTRWTVRTAAFRRFLDTYDAVVDTVEKVVDDRSVSADVKVKLRGILNQLDQFETLFGMIMALQLFEPCEVLSKKLQSPSMTSGETMKAAELLIDALQKQRSEEGFQKTYERVEEMVATLTVEVKPPKTPRTRKPPRRLEHTLSLSPCTPRRGPLRGPLRGRVDGGGGGGGGRCAPLSGGTPLSCGPAPRRFL